MKNTQNNELAVCGFAAVKALVDNNIDRVKRLYFTCDRVHDFGDACKKLAARKAPYNMVENPKDLERLSGTVHHQGVVAMIETPKIAALTTSIAASWLEKKESAIILDRVGNANNLGAIVRSAAFFGVKNIVIPLDESQSSITTSSYRVAQGGMEHVNVYSIRSIPRLLQDMKGKMEIIGTALDAKVSVSAISTLCATKPALIILGNEEHGISQAVKDCCDELVIIPFTGMKEGNAAPVESLNVAQAASIILYECSKINLK